MARKVRAKSGTAQRGRGHARPTRDPSTRGRNSGVWRFGGRTTLLFTVIGCAALGIVGLGRLYAAPSLALVPHLDGLEPQLRAYLSRAVERASSNPRDPDSHALLGRVYVANGFWAEASDSFENVLALIPDHVLAKYYHAVAQQNLGRTAQASLILADLVSSQPNFAPALDRLGSLLLVDGQRARATSLFQRALEIRPQSAVALASLAHSLLEEGSFEKAEELANRSIGIRPDYRMAHYVRGLSYRGLGRRDQADADLVMGSNARRWFMLDEWTHKIAAHAMGLQAQFDRASALAAQGRLGESIQLLETARKWSPENHAILSNLATFHMRRPDGIPTAKNLLLSTVKGNVITYEAAVALSACALRLNLIGEALSYADRAIDLVPQKGVAYRAKANALFKTGRNSYAREVLASALRQDPMNAANHLLLARAFVVEGRLGSAKSHYEQGVRLDPFNLKIRSGLATTCLSLGQVDEATATLSVMKELSPNAPLVRAVTDQIRQWNAG